MGILRKYQDGGDIMPKAKYADGTGGSTRFDATKVNKRVIKPVETGDPYFDAWKPVAYKDKPTRLDHEHENNKAILKELSNRISRNNEIRNNIYTAYNIDPTQLKESDYIDINKTDAEGNRLVSQEDLATFYDNLRWKQRYAKRAGFKVKQYYGDKEAEQMGYNENTPLEELKFGYRMLRDSQNQHMKRNKKGGILKYQQGGTTKKVVDKNKYASPDVTPLQTTYQNQTKLAPGQVDTTNYKELATWNPVYDESGTQLATDPNNQAVIDEVKRRNARIAQFRQGVAKRYGYDMQKVGVDDYIDPNATFPEGHAKAGERMIPENKLNEYYQDLEWKNAYRRRAGFNPKAYYGGKEAQQQGYTESTPIKDLKFGYRMMTGSQAPAKAKPVGNTKPMAPVYKKGGKIGKCKKGCGCKKCGGGVLLIAGKKKGGIMRGYGSGKKIKY